MYSDIPQVACLCADHLQEIYITTATDYTGTMEWHERWASWHHDRGTMRMDLKAHVEACTTCRVECTRQPRRQGNVTRYQMSRRGEIVAVDVYASVEVPVLPDSRQRHSWTRTFRRGVTKIRSQTLQRVILVITSQVPSLMPRSSPPARTNRVETILVYISKQ